MKVPKSKTPKLGRFFAEDTSPPPLTVKPSNQKDLNEIELMRQHHIDEPPVLGTILPVKSRVVTLSVLDLWETPLPSYQRDFQFKRMKVIVESMRIFGVQHKMFRIILNKYLQPIDGRHTIAALYSLNEPTVKGVVMEFENEEDEIHFFNHVNKAKMPMKKEHILYTQYLADEPIACLMYKLALEDPNSDWCGKVALLDAPTPSHKMNISNFSKVVNWTGIESRRRSEGQSRQRILNKIANTDYKIIRERVNKFYGWYYNFATYPRKKDDLFHNDKIITCMLNFFFYVYRQDKSSAFLEPDKLLASSIKFFSNPRRWDFRWLLQYEHNVATEFMIDKFNGTRSKYKMVIPTKSK